MQFDIFKFDFNILCTECFLQPLISAKSHTVCLLSLLTAESTFVTLSEFLSGGLPIRSAAGFLEISKVICILKPNIHSGEFALLYLL